MKPWALFDADDEGPHLLELDGAQVAVLSRRGPGKQVNEDAVAVLPCPGGQVLVVADGMGGHSAGDRAARIAVESIRDHLGQLSLESSGREALLDGFEAANREVLALGLGAGTTVAALLVRQGLARSLHVGDAVALHVGQRGRVKWRTIDHGPTAYAVEAGLLAEEDAIHHHDRHVVSNFVGLAGMRVEVGPLVPVARRDTLLLASDGLHDNLHGGEIVELVRRGELGGAVRELADRAQARMLDPEPDAPSKPDDLTLVAFRRTR